MIKPFKKDFILTQGFGENPASYTKFGINGHNGLDYGLPTGTEVKAPHSGKVIEATLDSKGYGIYLKIENDIEGSVLAHLREFRVGVGDTVSEGQLVAYSDNSGNSTGAHLHWGYYLFPRDRGNGYAGFINQLPLLGHITDTQQEVIDALRKARDDNWNLYQESQKKLAECQNKLPQEVIKEIIKEVPVEKIVEKIVEKPVEKVVYIEKIIDKTSYKKLSFFQKFNLLFS